MKHAVTAALAAAVLSLAGHAQTRLAREIRGRVIAADGGGPIVNARVAVVSADIGNPVVLTDDNGRFGLGVAESSGTRLTITKTGYGRLEVPVAGGDIEIRLERGAVLTGRVTDEFGEGVQGGRLLVQRPGATSDQPSVAVALSDDRGDYRLGGLLPGTYIISAATSSSPWTSLRVYYPGVPTADAGERLRLAAGEERGRVDFSIRGARSLASSLALMTPSPLGRPPSLAAGQRGATIRGRVVTPDRRSVSRAQLRLSPVANLSVQQFMTAEADGSFEFANLPPGKYAILAGKAGYTTSDLTLTIDVADGEVRDPVELVVRRWGAVSGRVVDERGEPLQGAAVRLLQIRFEAGRRRLVPALAAAPTDDLGRYRVFDVPPGRYVITASPGGAAPVAGLASAELPGYVRVFYPNATDAGRAQFVSIDEAQEVTGIDVALARGKTARVSGKLVDAAGLPTMGGNVMLLPARASAGITYVGAGARIEADGRFEFTDVPSGSYVIKVSRGKTGRAAEGEFGTLPVIVNGNDVTGLIVQTSAGSSIRGRFSFEARDPQQRPPRAATELTVVPVDIDLSPSMLAIADIKDDWLFEMRGVNGPRRLTMLRTPPGWALKEIRVNGIDTTDRPLAFGRADQSLQDVEVVLTDRVSELAVQVKREANAVARRGEAIVVFSTDRSRWYATSRFQRASPIAAEGPTTITGLPFGTYFAVAVQRLPDEGEDAWQDPEFLERLARTAAIVTIRDGERQAVDLPLQ